MAGVRNEPAHPTRPTAPRENTNPGIIGSQKLRTRKSIVAERAAARLAPVIFNVTTDATSKDPSPPGSRFNMRKRLDVMKLADTPSSGERVPSERSSAHTVA